MAIPAPDAVELHLQRLQKFCRVCARKMNKGYKHRCSNSGTVLKAFGIDSARDHCGIHPPFYCHNCHNTARRLNAVGGAESSVQVHMWCAHSEECEVCSMGSALHLGGRKKKESDKRGRPSKEGPKGIANSILCDAPETWKTDDPLSIPRFLPPSTSLLLNDFQCAICNNIVDRPVTTPCRKLVCAECISTTIRASDNLDDMQCPSCSNIRPITPTTFTPASDVALKVLGGLLLLCTSCSAIVGLQHLRAHIETGCMSTTTAFSPSKLTVGQMLSRPLQSPPTSAEQKAAAKVVQRLLHTPSTESQPVIQLATNGTPLSLVRVNSPRVSSSNASRWTIKRRSSQMSSVREFISSGSSATQLEDETRDEQREKASPTALSPQETLALKTGAVLPWNKIRLIRRYLSSQGIKLASERSMRLLSKDIIGDNLVAEEAPFSQPLRVGVDVLLSPLVYVPDLGAKIFQLLEENDRANRLTWHNGIIPESEVWVKIGGDKGADTVKVVFQLCNVISPNSVNNTCVFCVFEGKDTSTNLHVALDRYKTQVERLRTTKWRGKSMRLFMTGDYEFLSRMYGISGAQGKHPCLWCTITSVSMKVPREDRPEVPVRTLDTLQADLLRFQTAGKGNIKTAKQFNNVIGPHLFSIPIDQVCPPGLHITLGIFYRIWSLLEEGCHELDLELATRTSHNPSDRETFKKYSLLVKELTQLSEKRLNLVQLVSSLNSVLGDLVISSDSNPLVQALKTELDTQSQKLEKVERDISAVQTKCSEGFPIHDGPFIRCLEKVLGEIHVHREAYYGGTFTGNNAHRCLKAVNVDALCAAIPQLAVEKCPEIEDQAQAVINKYGRALLLFSKCHNAFNSSKYFDPPSLSTLLGDIDDFIRYYRSTFPNSSVTPKLHMLEDHVVPFLRRWRVGLGMLNEQDIESIHSRFNTLQRTYGSMRNKVERLKCMVEEHFRQISPQNLSRLPPAAKRHKGDAQDE